MKLFHVTLIFLYLLNKVYIDFAALYKIHRSGAFFVTRAKVTMNYSVIERNFNIDETTGLRTDEIIQLNGYQTSKYRQ